MQTRLTAVREEDARLIGEEPPAPVAQPVPRETSRAQSALTGLLLTSLRALSQRAIVAFASLVDLALIVSAFALWLLVIRDPSTLQLAALAGYAVFILAAILLRRRE
jgi:hypothetical protein